jgi:hypothetical protein
MGTIILSALVAHTGWHWMLERGERLRQFPIQLPVLTYALLASLLRWLMVLVFLAAVLWLILGVLRPRMQRKSAEKALGVGAGTPEGWTS